MPLFVLINILGPEFCFFRYFCWHCPSTSVLPFIFQCLSLCFMSVSWNNILLNLTFYPICQSLPSEFIDTSKVINIVNFILSTLSTISFSFFFFFWISHFSSLSFLCSFLLYINLAVLLCFKVPFMAMCSSVSSLNIFILSKENNFILYVFLYCIYFYV